MKMLNFAKRRKLVCLLTLTLIIVSAQIPASVEANSDAAPLQYPAPSGTGTFLYVPEYWQNGNPSFPDPQGRTRTIAYQRGFQVPTTAARPNIVLDFGRQVLAASGNWGIVTIPDNAKHSMLWVHNIAQDFMEGYSNNPNHPTAFIAIGTNNGNYNWLCENNDAVSVTLFL